jgi:hypothetical protein
VSAKATALGSRSPAASRAARAPLNVSPAPEVHAGGGQRGHRRALALTAIAITAPSALGVIAVMLVVAAWGWALGDVIAAAVTRLHAVGRR